MDGDTGDRSRKMDLGSCDRETLKLLALEEREFMKGLASGSNDYAQSIIRLNNILHELKSRYGIDF